MEHSGFTTIKLKDWRDFKQYVEQFSENWAFRGQADATWVLNNAIERTDFVTYYKGIEVDFLSEFQRGARNYLSKDETPEHLIEWLALMQHHGAPTRLLDLTKSPYIAAYFAFEQCGVTDDYHVSIWCINVEFLKKKSLEILSEEFSEALKETDNLINENLFQKLFYKNNKSLVFPVEPFRMNRRYSLQQSIFISTGISEEPLMKQFGFLGEDLPKAVVKLDVPSKYKNEALRNLQTMNLNRASLFPDLDGYALSLRLRYNSMKSPDQIQQENREKQHDDTYQFFP